MPIMVALSLQPALAVLGVQFETLPYAQHRRAIGTTTAAMSADEFDSMQPESGKAHRSGG